MSKRAKKGRTAGTETPKNIRPRRLNGIAWAVASWSRVTQKQVSRAKVIAYAKEHGWAFFAAELNYWSEQAKLPGARKYAPHPKPQTTSQQPQALARGLEIH